MDATVTGLAFWHDPNYWYANEANQVTVYLTRTYGYGAALVGYWLPLCGATLLVTIIVLHVRAIRNRIHFGWFNLVLVLAVPLSWLGWIGWLGHLW
jgi:hypothetical protein